MTAQSYFHEYFKDWIETYKHGAVRPITYQKYQMTLRRLSELAPNIKICEINKRTYQTLINEYAKTHEKQTTTDFHHQLKGAILDAMDEGLIRIDPTRKIVIKGKLSSKKKHKFLSILELHALLNALDLRINNDKEQSGNGKYHVPAFWDWAILLMAKTGLRFSEALGLTQNDFDFSEMTIKITKTWNYKDGGGFAETKNNSSKRIVLIDEKLNMQLREFIESREIRETPVFVRGRVFNSTINSRLKALCQRANIPVISAHGLRHTHASHLLHAGISIASIAKRLGHANTTTTQGTYLHIIKELEVRDNEKILCALGAL